LATIGITGNLTQPNQRHHPIVAPDDGGETTGMTKRSHE
jgi:hypothetical protein